VHTKLEFSPPEPFLRFAQQTCPIHYFRSKTHVLGWFRPISLPHVTHYENGCRVHTKHEFLSPEPILRFSQQTCPIHYFRSKTHVWVGFTQFRCRTSPITKSGVGCIQSMSFCYRNQFFVFRNKHAQSTTLGPKLMFRVVSRNFVASRQPFRKRVSGCIQNTSFCISSFFATNTQSSTLGKNSCLGWFRTISLPHVTNSENGCRGAYKHEFLPPEPFLRFSQRTCPIHYFRSKTHVWVVSRNFVATRHPFRKRVSGCIQSTSFSQQTCSILYFR
jgi:hypothetical protein